MHRIIWLIADTQHVDNGKCREDTWRCSGCDCTKTARSCTIGEPLSKQMHVYRNRHALLFWRNARNVEAARDRLKERLQWDGLELCYRVTPSPSPIIMKDRTISCNHHDSFGF